MKLQAEAAVEKWNKTYPVGQMVKVYPILDEEEGTYNTKTRSQAWVMGGHSAMVLIEGVSGGFCLENLKPLVGTGTVDQQPNLLDISLMAGKEVAA